MLYNLSDERVIQKAKVDIPYKYFLNLEPQYLLIHPSPLTKFRKLSLNNEDILEDESYQTILSQIKRLKSAINPQQSPLQDINHISQYRGDTYTVIEVTMGEVSDGKYLEPFSCVALNSTICHK